MPELAAFDERTGQRILAAVRYYERIIRGGTPGRGRWPVLSPEGLVLVRTPSGGIPANGTATVTFYEADGETIPTLGTRTETIKDPFGAAWSGDRKLWATYWGGALRPVVEACAAEPEE